MVGCTRDGESEYGQLIDNFVEWKDDLLLNINKTEELVVDFRRTQTGTRLIMDEELGIVEEDKCLDWTEEPTNAVYKKMMSKFNFLRKLRSFSVCTKILEISLQSVVVNSKCCSLLGDQIQ